MARKQNDPIPENNPQGGGSFTRDPATGDLVQTEGTDMAQQFAPAPAVPQTSTSQE